MNRDGELWYVAEHQSLGILVGFGLLVVLCVVRAFFSEYFLVYWGAGLACFGFMLLFYSVRVECDRDEMRVSYGIGVFSRVVPIFGIAHAGPVKNDRLSTFPFQPSAQRALEIVLRDGGKFSIPSDQPKELAQALLLRSSAS